MAAGNDTEQMIRFDPRARSLMELYAKANHEKDRQAQFLLAELYRQRSTKAAEKKAYYLYKCAAAQGLAEGRYMMGYCLEHGIGVRQSYQEAVEQYIRADRCVENDLWNNMDALDAYDREKAGGELLRLYFESPGFQKYFDQEFDTQYASEEDRLTALQAAAESGDADAQNELGHLYFYGQGCASQDRALAKFWYEKSALQGCEAGIHHLAELLKREKNYKEAALWFRKYAEISLRYRKQRLGW